MVVDAGDRASQIAVVIEFVPIVVAVVSVVAATGRLVQPVSRRPAAVASAPRRSGIEALGRRIRSAVGREPDMVLDRALGRAVVASVLLACVQIELGVVLFLAIRSAAVLQRRRATMRQAGRIGDGLADVIDLFAVALLSGSTVANALHQVAGWAATDLAEAFQWCERHVAHGHTLSDALELLPARLGPQVRPLVAALVATERHGAPIAHQLSQLAADSRADRRRRAEAAARRLPVAMLFPLVVCVLPAFLLVTVVPVIGETLDAFNFAASP